MKNLPNLLPKNKKILIIYGGGSIKTNGVYNDVMSEISTFDTFEFKGIEPNPKFETCMQAIKLVREENIDFLLSVGGGSVLDATKFIAAAADFEGDEWSIVEKHAPIKTARPFGSVITLPATGSEMNCYSVISHKEKNLKFGWASKLIYPQFSIIDPRYTFSLSKRQMTNGIVDTFVHIMEQYCTYDVNTPVQDGFCFSVLKALISNSQIALDTPNDYDSRANLFWAATCGLNNWCSVGCVEDWSTHAIGHELSALYGLDHGQSLAIVLPSLLRYTIKHKRERLEKLGREVFGLNVNDAFKSIVEIEKFFTSVGAKLKLQDFDINKTEAANLISQRFQKRDLHLGERGDINYSAVLDILLEY